MEDFKEIGLQIVAQAKELVIADEQDYMVAESFGKVISDEIKKIKAYFKKPKADAKQGWQNWIDAEKSSLEDPEKAKSILKVSMLTYENEQERIRRVEEDRLRRELADRLRKVKERAEEDGLEIIPPEIVPEDIVVAPSFQRQGTTRANWKAEITDLKKFYETCLKTDNYDYLLPNMPALNSIAKSLKKESTIPGVRFYNEPVKVF